MRFVMLVKADKDSEAGVLPGEQILADMARYNESMVKAGVMLAAEGLRPSAKGARVRFAGGKPRVTDGPFAEIRELVAGFWLIQTRSMDEAIEWARRVPFQEGEIEIRPVFELSDFPPGEAVEHHAQLQQALAKAQGKGGGG
jgi:hypothetical protein